MILSTDRLSAIAVVVALLGATSAAAQQAYDPMSGTLGGQTPAPQDGETVATNPEFEDLPDTEGVEDTYYHCVACHSTAIIKQQNLSDARWDYLWGWMVEEQGMPDADEETKELILTYLKRHFSSER